MAFDLILKWGGIKGWENATDEAMDLFDEWLKLGASRSAMIQRDTPRQKEIICKIIDIVDGEIINDWSGETLDKTNAKKYVMEYGK